ncbi:MAG: prepilin-type N-terminal cleavage/methylation domain-containing protein, partial [Thermodesulfobacteriota bacterium]|nr:prepilin-type N-terminal cleavage/methylation domain-containing protein [Thermodesulfobacteriota bacterium]
MWNKNQFSSGFTLLELIMTIVILGSTSLILVPFFQSISRSPDPMLRQRAISLGQAMMDEIMSKKWDEETPNGGGPICSQESNATRASVDNCSRRAGNIG